MNVVCVCVWGGGALSLLFRWRLTTHQPINHYKKKRLSGELAKYVHGMYLQLEPFLRKVQKRLGLLRIENKDSSSANDALSKRRASLLLGLAR